DPFTESIQSTRWFWLNFNGLENLFSCTCTTFNTFSTTSCCSRYIFRTPFTFSGNTSTFHTFHRYWTDKFFLICSFFYCCHLFCHSLFLRDRLDLWKSYNI